MKRVLLILSLIVITAVAAIVSTVYFLDTSGTPGSYDVYLIDSEILSEQREVIVSTPKAYGALNSKDFPVVYVFGGNTLTYSISYDLKLLERTGYMESAIVVGIPNISQKTRQRDLTPPFMKQDLDEPDSPLGKADQYLKYVEEEVIPLIEKNYRTNSERIAVGHSREGLMVMYSLINNPGLFDGRLALSPALWREDNVFVSRFKEHMQQQDTLMSKLFLSMGTEEVEKMKTAFDLTTDFLEKDSIPLAWKSSYTEGAYHSNNALLSAPVGLDWILKK